jgi:predicted ATP-binding protein involved in virulence
VLVDELDVHLHPRWQRRVAGDLQRVFPNIQFVATSHSPQVIGEVPPNQVFLLDGDRTTHPAQSFGMDSNWVLRVLMGADEQDADVRRRLDQVFRSIEDRDLTAAEQGVAAIRREIGNNEAVQRAASTIERVRLLGR